MNNNQNTTVTIIATSVLTAALTVAFSYMYAEHKAKQFMEKSGLDMNKIEQTQEESVTAVEETVAPDTTCTDVPAYDYSEDTEEEFVPLPAMTRASVPDENGY